MNILVIEDEPISAKLACAVLASEGYTVRDVTAAEQAIIAIEQSKPDLIVLDLKLPGVDGLTFARQLKQDPQTQDIAIIAVTAYSNLWSRRDVIGAGCDAYLVKPVEPQTLRQQVADIAAQRFA